MDQKIRIPLDRLMKQARRIGDGDLRADLSIQGKDELAEMATTTNDIHV